MSGLFESLTSVSNALIAQRMGLDVVGQNLANINTPGYSRRMLELAEVPPTDPYSAGRGVNVVAVRALRDQLVEARLRREEGGAAYDHTLAQLLGAVETAMGLPGESLDVQLADFFGAFSALADDPTSLAARDSVVRNGQGLAAAFRNLAGALAGVQTDADAGIRADVNEMNRLTEELATLNVDISAAGPNVESLKDRQNVILSRLGSLADVAVLPRPDGGVDVTLRSGHALVIGESSYALDVTPTGLADISLDGVSVTSAITSGRIGGLLHMRDVVVPDYLSDLDTMAYDLAVAVNTVHATGYDMTGAAGGAFFQPLASAAGAAQLLAVDPGVVADPRLVVASGTGAIGDNAVAIQLAALRDASITSGGTRTVFDAWSQYVYRAASDAADARAASTSHDDVVRQIQQVQAQVSGVSYDEEAAHMMRYQRAYEANARYFQTILTTLDTLMEMVQ